MGSPGHGHRLLLVEDDDDVRARLRRGLGAGGFEVMAVGTGSAALAHAEDRPDALVIDVRLPDGDGRDVRRALRARGVDAPVLFLTAAEDGIEWRENGGDDYLKKPVDAQEVAAHVRVLLGGPAATIAVGSAHLDPAAHALRHGEHVAPLTPTEYRVLETLARHRATVVRRKDLVRAAWPEGAVVYDNTLDQYVARLRRKLRAVAGDASITTLRGVGYRLD